MTEVTSDSAQGRVGSVLRGKWALGRVIGAGGTATVYEGTHCTNGKRVAIKVLHSYFASSPDVVARFAREGTLANTVGHAGVVEILDDDVTEDGAPFLVMERLEGEALPARLVRQRGGVGVATTLWIAGQVLDILAAAHARGITHRDVKPDNVFLTADGRVMLLDFGIARSGAPSDAEKGWTQDGAAIGTPQYMPPEQARGRWSEVDAQSDLWSVGAMMYRLLTGRAVREASTAAEVLRKAMTEPAPDVAAAAPSVPPEVTAIVTTALALEKSARWPDARAMQQAIHAASGTSTVTTSTRSLASLRAPGPCASASSPASSAPEASWKRWPLLPMAVGFAALALGAAVAYPPLKARVRAMPKMQAAASGDVARAVFVPRVEASSAPAAPSPASTIAQPAPPSTGVAASLAIRPIPARIARPRPAPSAIPASPEVPTMPTVSPLERRH